MNLLPYQNHILSDRERHHYIYVMNQKAYAHDKIIPWSSGLLTKSPNNNVTKKRIEIYFAEKRV